MGYRVREVEEALAERDAELTQSGVVVAEMRAALTGRDELIGLREQRIEQLNGVAHHLSRLVVEREAELRELRSQLAELGNRYDPDDLEALLQARDEEAADALQKLQRDVAEIGAQARGQATRIRMQALRQAVRFAARGGADGGEADVDVPVEARSGEEATPAAQPRFGLGERPAAEPLPEETGRTREFAAIVAMNGDPGPAGSSGAVGMFEGLVQMEIGPLEDFSQLVRFEDAIREIEAASEVSVKRFSRGRATLALRLQEPVELLRELERRAPFGITVRGIRDDRLIVDLNEAA